MKKYLAFAALPLMASLLSCGGDSEEDIKIDCANSSLEVSVSEIINAECDSQGSIEISATGGSGTVQYSINGTTFQSSNIFNVSAGDYTVTARDNAKCTATVEATVNAAGNAISITQITPTNSGCGTSGATITVTASGGVGTLQYKLNSGSLQSGNTFTNVAAGSYTITVDDGTCSAQQTTQVKTGTSLTNDIMPIISAECATSGCHNGSQSPNLSSASNVRTNAAAIKAETQSGRMPRNGSLTANQKALIACWVDDGALNN